MCVRNADLRATRDLTRAFERGTRVNYILLFSNLHYRTNNPKRGSSSAAISYGYFCFTGAAVADGNAKSSAVFAVWSTLFDHIDLDGMEGEDLQRKEDLMAAGDWFAVVGIDEIPLICSLTGKLLNGKGKLIDAVGKRFCW